MKKSVRNDNQKDDMQPSYGGRDRPLYQDESAESVSGKPVDLVSSGDAPVYRYADPRYWEYR